MPELPEVEALRVFLGDHLVGREIAGVLPLSVNVLKTYDPPPAALEGATVTSVDRHGKFLDIGAGPLHLVTHLARAGWLRWRDSFPAKPPGPGKGPLALRTVLTGGDGFDLTEMGSKKRLAVYLVHDPMDVPGIARLGPDPLAPDFDRDALAALLDGERRQIKGALRDQSLIAGIGNAYSDEILHAAKMSPFKRTADLDEDDISHLHAALRTTLEDAVARSSGIATGELKSEKRSGMRVHGRAGEPCPVCGDTVLQVSFSDSALQYCPTCQTGGKPLADRRTSRFLK
ncbi:DNA-formamidopyrimidine glycosylase family protein [Streptomyces sp. NPDC008125]|uniref:Fpg/Nei family DNA glycosylase n=1 Tax=Streptomyces sp. NPDC008125 TaxID=3364811 RepID=UPI0036E06316